jgi:hypothetical protein
MYVILSSAVIAPPWVRPSRLSRIAIGRNTDGRNKDERKPELGSMPLEILERIIVFTMGDVVGLKISFKGIAPLVDERGSVLGSVQWWPQWLPYIMLVSERFRLVTQSLLPKLSLGLNIEVQNTRALDHPMERKAFLASRAYKVALRHFEKLVGTEPADLRVY